MELGLTPPGGGNSGSDVSDFENKIFFDIDVKLENSGKRTFIGVSAGVVVTLESPNAPPSCPAEHATRRLRSHRR